MSRVFFRYGPMNAGKSAQILMVRHNYMERGQKTFLLKPSVDNRDGADFIWARIGLEAKVDGLIAPEDDIWDLYRGLVDEKGVPDCVLVDESQFLTRSQVEQFCEIADEQKVPVMAFGLRADFKGELFPGSAALFALADRIEEMKTVCWCGRKATANARLRDGKVVMDGPQVQIGGNQTYISLCRKHWRAGRPAPEVQ